jgi:transposase
MNDARTPPPGIAAADWAATPQAVRILVVALQAQVVALQDQVVAQQAQIVRLTERLAVLEERVGRSSRNSSQPPSSDPPSVSARPQRKRSGRKQGGQPGHTGHGRALLPPEQVDELVEVRPLACADCGALLLGADPAPARRQVTELPRVVPVVREYRQHTLTCHACGAATTAAWPAGLPAGSFGPRVAATVAYLTGRCGVSKREAQEILHAVCHLEVGLGSIAALERQVSAAVAAPVAAAQAYVRAQPVVNADETSWQQQATGCWVWTAVTALVTVFLVRASRSSQSAKELLGAAYAGIVGSDRYSGYTWLAPGQRQVCWAHLIRDFTALVARGGASKALGTALLDATDDVFALWYRVRDGTLTRADFSLAMAPQHALIHTLLVCGQRISTEKTRRFCDNLLKLEPALWTFVRVPGVEPTNNSAERALRRAVLWRRRSFGTQSAAGSRFVERILTTVTTLRQQQRDVLDYLAAACLAVASGLPAPSLLPSSAAPPACVIADLTAAA